MRLSSHVRAEQCQRVEEPVAGVGAGAWAVAVRTTRGCDYAAPLAPTLNVRQLARLAAAGTLQAPHTDTPAQFHTRGSMQLTCIVARFRKKAVGERDGAGALVFLAALSFAASARL